MKKLFSTKYSASAFNIATLILRIGLGGLMIPHGYDKLVHFAQYRKDFINFLGMGSTMSLSLCIFAEFFCALFLIFGLFSRLVSIPLIINVAVAVVMAHNSDIFGEGEHATLFLVGFITILLIGPGKASLDGMMGK